MNPDEVFALLRRADPATDATREDQPVTDFSPEPRRSPPWARPLAFATAAALVVILAIGPLGFLGGGDDVVEKPTTTVPTPTTVPATTSGPTATTTPTTTSTAVPAAAGGLLIADGEFITWGGGGVTPAVGIPAKVAFDDLAGGVVYQLALPYVGDSGDSTVYHLPAGATEPRVLRAASGEAWERLMNVVSIDGSPTALVVERRDPTSFEDAVETLFEIDLATSEAREVAVVGGWESGLDAISWDGSSYVASSFAEAYTFLQKLDRDGTFTPWTGELPAECFDDSSCPRLVVGAPGERLIMIREGDLVEWDRSTDREVQRIDLPEGIWLAPIIWQNTVVLNRYADGFTGDHGEALVIDLSDGSIIEAAPGFADWVDGPAIGLGPVDDTAATPTLLIDGVGQDASACAGADGAIVFVFDDGRRAMVGFEEGTFIRFIDAGGSVHETAAVAVDESLPPTYTGTVDVDGTNVAITIVATSGVGLPECTS